MNAPQPVRVGVVGCGAVTRLYYTPALRTAQADGLLRVVAAYDPDRAAARGFCAEFPTATLAADLEQLLGRSPDLVIVASPPVCHAEQTIAALAAGADVHCEKPFALTLSDGERMVSAAASAGRRLSVGLMRRHFPATQAIGRLIADGAIGHVSSIDCYEGGPFSWPVRSPDYFGRDAGSTGVLADIGTHCVDLLVWWFGAPSHLSYEDDEMGGVECNCRIELRFGDVRATVRLSRDWQRPNRYVITGTRGWIGWSVTDANHFELGIGTRYVGAVEVHDASTSGGDAGAGNLAADFHEAFSLQLRRLLTEEGDDLHYVSGADALQSLAIIERCYLERRQMSMPWMFPAGGRAP